MQHWRSDMGYERNAIGKMQGYEPGKQPDTAGTVKLNTNENPYPPCDAVMAAIKEVSAESLRRYPPPTADGLRQSVARVHKLAPENVLAVNGGDELLRLAVTTFVEHGRPVGMVVPSYSLYPVLADIHGSPVASVDATQDWAVPGDLGQRMNQAGVQLTFVVNPHAPSGRLTPKERIAQLAMELDGVLLVDEAYVDFVDPAMGYDAVELVTRFDNLILLRSLSKGYSLAGLRVGYGLGSAALIRPMLEKTRDSYNLDAIAQMAATASLENRDKARLSWERVRTERLQLRQALIGLGLQVPESQANFLLAGVPEGRMSASDIQRALERRGILVRHFDQPRLRDQLRITVGSPEQNRKLTEEIGRLLGQD